MKKDFDDLIIGAEILEKEKKTFERDIFRIRNMYVSVKGELDKSSKNYIKEIESIERVKNSMEMELMKAKNCQVMEKEVSMNKAKRMQILSDIHALILKHKIDSKYL